MLWTQTNLCTEKKNIWSYICCDKQLSYYVGKVTACSGEEDKKQDQK